MKNVEDRPLLMTVVFFTSLTFLTLLMIFIACPAKAETQPDWSIYIISQQKVVIKNQNGTLTPGYEVDKIVYKFPVATTMQECLKALTGVKIVPLDHPTTATCGQTKLTGFYFLQDGKFDRATTKGTAE